nr:hemin uptake protein HemP [Nitratireductor aestuarii]
MPTQSRPDAGGKGHTSVRTLKSEDILRGSKEVVIEHAGTVYRLKLTRQNKLILNK